MSSKFEIIQLKIEGDALKKLPVRQRNQLVGCMHAHNELVVLNRLLMFSLNDVGDGDLHNHAQGVQMWCVLQVLTGKLFETWNMLSDRFLRSNPEDSSISKLSSQHKKSLVWLKKYFGDQRVKRPRTLWEKIAGWLSRFGILKGQSRSPNQTALQTIRDKTAFHYDKLNLTQAVNDLADTENHIYLAQHPANGLYYVGSALVFSTVFAMIADMAGDTAGMTQGERMSKGVHITLAHVNEANLHLHNVLYGLIAFLLEKAFGKPLEQIEQFRIEVLDAPKPTKVGLPMFLDVGT
jgi:hypothetical protein